MIARRSDVLGGLAESVAPVIRRYAAAMEEAREMPLELHTELRAAGLFSLYVPVEFGGLGLTLPEALRVVEQVARIDGSAGWTVALSFASGYFTCGVEEPVARRILGDGRNLTVGSSTPLRAEPVEGGFRIFGQSKFVSGIRHADWMSGPAVIFDGESPRIGPEGAPEMVGILIPRSDIEVIDTWNATGLRGTGTHDARFSGQFVPVEQTVPFSPLSGLAMKRDEVISRWPFFSLVGVVQTPAVALGIARHAMDEFVRIAGSKANPTTGVVLRDRTQVQVEAARAEAAIRSSRLLFYSEIDAFWRKLESDDPVTLEDRAGIRIAATHLAETCTGAVDSLARLAGTSAIMPGTEFERAWRDIHAAAAHVQAQDINWEPAGQVLLGVTPGSNAF